MELAKNQNQYLAKFNEPKNPVEAYELSVLKKRYRLNDFINLKMKSFQDVFQLPCADFETILKFMGYDQAFGICYSLLLKEFKVQFSEEDIELIAEEIIETYSSLKPSDVIYFSRLLKLGKLGTIYKELRTDYFFGESGFVPKYIDMKFQFVEDYYMKKKNVAATVEKEVVPMPEKYKTKYLNINKSKETRPVFNSISDYVEHEKLNKKEFFQSFLKRVQSDWITSPYKKIMTWKQFKLKRQRDFLFHINKSSLDFTPKMQRPWNTKNQHTYNKPEKVQDR